MFRRVLVVAMALTGVGLFGCAEESENSAAPANLEESVDSVEPAKLAVAAQTPVGWLPYPENAGPLPGWTGKVFQLSVDFPSQVSDEQPQFMSIDFQQNPDAYWRSVRNYIYEGNIGRGDDPQGNSLDWNTQTNPVRTWYNMPWRAYGPNAREFINGLTREFPASPGTLDPTQQHFAYTWARAIYNPIAAYTLGQVWDDETGPPDLADAKFADGAVIAKLLFTTAVESDVPYVRDAYTWQANTYADPKNCDKEDCARKVTDVHLFQIDFAIKDPRASETQWVFGTFVHDPSLPGDGFSWDKMVPLGFMWGNDPGLTSNDPNGVPTQSKIYDNTHIYEHMGCHKRLVGPVDNPKSACLSCHMSAQHPLPESPIAPGKLEDCDSPGNAAYWTNLKSGDILWPTDGAYSLDYSMEMTSAVQNYFTASKQITISSDGKTYRDKDSDQEHNTARRHE